MAVINKSQEIIDDSTIKLKLYKGNVYPIARESDSFYMMKNYYQWMRKMDIIKKTQKVL